MRSQIAFVALCLAGGGFAAAADVLTPGLGQTFEKKVAVVRQRADAPSKSPRATTFSQAELNSYLRFQATDLLPTGLADPVLTLIGNGRITGRAVVDLDVVRRTQGSGSWFDPTSYLTGTLPVSATGAIVAADGVGRFVFEQVEVSGVPVPKALLAQLVNFFSRTSDNPAGAGLDDTFELPAKIKRITVEPGRFSVIQ